MSDDSNAAAVIVGGAPPAAPPPATTPPPAAGNGAVPGTDPPRDATLLDNWRDDDEGQAPLNWPDDWRERFAKAAGKDGDEALKTVKRWANPENVFKSWLDLRRRMSAGQLAPTAPGEGATEEEVAAYRKTAGIPESPDGYELSFPEGVQAGDAQKAQLAEIAKVAHAENIRPEHVKTLLSTYIRLEQESAQRHYEEAQQAAEDAKVELRTEYGRDFRKNINVANKFAEEHGGEAAKDIMRWTLRDGTPLGNKPEFVRLMVNAGLATVGADGAEYNEATSGGKTLDELIADEMALQFTNTKEYDKPEREKARLKLFDARNKRDNKAA